MAHWWGFVVGAVEGVAAEGWRIKERASAGMQRIAAGGALGLVAVAWVLATR